MDETNFTNFTMNKLFGMKSILLIAGFISFMHSCNKEKVETTDTVISIAIDFSNRQQPIMAFGASDAWGCQFAGKNWPVNKRERMAELLFSNDTDTNGNPKGIGLSGWRFNIGGGSAEQGANSEIGDEWRRAECFLNEDGTYNWQKQHGQRWFLNAAKNYGVNCLTAFVNSPPVYFTKNGKARSDGGSSTNLRADKFNDFATFIAEVLIELKIRDNINFQYISPVNEPQWDWNEKGQEGSPFLNTEIASLVRLLSPALQNKDLSTKIEVTDAGHIAYLSIEHDKPGRGKQAYEFFSKGSQNYIGDVPNVALKVSGHSYFSTYPVGSMLLDQRRLLSSTFSGIDPNLQYWQTEYCLLEDNEEIKGSSRDLGMDPALYTARLIHFDMTLANSCSWYWWLAISPYDYKDGLIYIDKDKNDGNIYESKIMWALGNYSHFIKPGMFRYNVSRSDNKTDEVASKSLMVSGYGTEDKSKAVFVLVNYSKYTTSLVTLKTLDKRKPKSVKVFTTSAAKEDNLKLSVPSDPDGILSLIPRSVVTVVMEF